MRDRPSYKMYNLARARPIVIRIKPRCAVAAYQGSTALFTGYKNVAAGWNDCVSPSHTIEHFGIKFIIEVLNPSAAVNYMNMKIEATYHMSFKDPI